jgi:hypothetical protein
MELHMKAICEGRMTKYEVVQQSLEQYREVFIKTNQQINVLKGVSIGCFPIQSSLMGSDDSTIGHANEARTNRQFDNMSRMLREGACRKNFAFRREMASANGAAR